MNKFFNEHKLVASRDVQNVDSVAFTYPYSDDLHKCYDLVGSIMNEMVVNDEVKRTLKSIK